MIDWFSEFPIAITICDQEGIILHMNEKSQKTFEKYGGNKLIGKSLFDCHPEAAGTKIREILKKQKTNTYTIEKNGQKKLIYQSPWYQNKKFMGLVEMSFEIPFEMPHYIRKNKETENK